MLGGSDDELVDRVGAYAAAGADQVNISLRAPFDVDALERFSAAAGLPAVADDAQASTDTSAWSAWLSGSGPAASATTMSSRRIPQRPGT